MGHAGAFVAGLHLAAIAVEAVAIGALIYLIWRIEHWRKTFEALLSEVKAAGERDIRQRGPVGRG